METQMLKTTVTNFFTKKAGFILSFLLTIFITPAAFTEPVPDKEKATVQCLKVENNQLFFMVNFDNAAGEKFDVLVNDEMGENLYHGVFKDSSFHKVFRAPADIGKLYIVIRTSKDKDNYRFEVKAQSKIVQQAYVKRM